MGKRGPKPILTERDKKVLVDLYMSRIMTGTQLQKSAFGSPSRYNRERLQILRERGYLLRRTYRETQNDKARSFDFDGFVFELTDKGLWEAEGVLGERLFTRGGLKTGTVDQLKIKSSSVGRYLQTAEVYMGNKGKVQWLPHFKLRQKVAKPDFTIACLAAVEKHGEIAILFGINSEPNMKALSMNLYHMRNAKKFGLQKHVLMCPNNDMVKMALEYYKEQSIEGELHVMTYQAAQEDLPLVFDGCEDILIEELRNFYGRWCQVHPASGRNSSNFFQMFEHKPNRFTYFADLSTGNHRMLEKVEFYNQRRAEEDAPFNNKSVRAVYALVRDYEQFEFVKGLLDNHQHVRLIIRDAPGRPMYGCTRDGQWVQVEKPVQRVGGR